MGRALCDWRKRHFNDGVEPSTWIIGDQVLAADGKSILFASLVRPGGTNLVLYNDALADTDSVLAHDPHHMLPKIRIHGITDSALLDH
jgi:hypothetical protein